MASTTSLLEYDEQFTPDVRRDLLTNIQEEADRLSAFVANLLSMTKLDSGVLEVRSEPVPIREVVHRVVDRLRTRCGERRLTPLVLSPELAAQADPMLLEQALMNVAENAVKFSPAGSEVMIAAEVAGSRVVIEVMDEGLGVPEAERPRIFDKFYRVADPRSSAQGSGLGLSIAKGMIEAMSGDISAGGRTDGRAGLSVQLRLPLAA
ncbi:MAG TPA: ATP-binding protein [Caulobacteraceae bacterium]